MWPFNSRPTRESLAGHRKVTVLGQRFIIRRLSPLVDFPPESMPQIFTDTTRGRVDLNSQAAQKRIREDMCAVLRAGVVDPPLVRDPAKGITAEDVFRDVDVGTQLYLKIIEHSLFRFKAWQLPFFFTAKLLLRFTVWLRSTARGRATSPSRASA